MELDGKILFLILSVFYSVSGLIGEGEVLLVDAVPHLWRPTKLFVFGDSSAATGNNVASLGSDSDICWHSPYGETFPGKPTARFSDGRVLTDFIAKFIAVKSPLAYKIRNAAGYYSKYGMNFAYGGHSRNEEYPN
ncbi:PREDICTED: GDSL esterase/lipase At5g03610-like [Fragaria vesca subsp. vesca]